MSKIHYSNPNKQYCDGAGKGRNWSSSWAPVTCKRCINGRVALVEGRLDDDARKYKTIKVKPDQAYAGTIKLKDAAGWQPAGNEVKPKVTASVTMIDIDGDEHEFTADELGLHVTKIEGDRKYSAEHLKAIEVSISRRDRLVKCQTEHVETTRRLKCQTERLHLAFKTGDELESELKAMTKERDLLDTLFQGAAKDRDEARNMLRPDGGDVLAIARRERDEALELAEAYRKLIIKHEDASIATKAEMQAKMDAIRLAVNGTI